MKINNKEINKIMCSLVEKNGTAEVTQSVWVTIGDLFSQVNDRGREAGEALGSLDFRKAVNPHNTVIDAWRNDRDFAQLAGPEDAEEEAK